MKISVGSLAAIFAIVMLILAINTFNSRVGGSEEYESYGGDAYTGIQNAAAQTANNVQKTNEILAFGLGAVLLGFSFGFATLSVYCFAGCSVKKPQNNQEPVVSAIESVIDAKEEQPATEPEEVTAVENGFCPKCGSKLYMNNSFCSKCGEFFAKSVF